LIDRTIGWLNLFLLYLSFLTQTPKNVKEEEKKNAQLALLDK